MEEKEKKALEKREQQRDSVKEIRLMPGIEQGIDHVIN